MHHTTSGRIKGLPVTSEKLLKAMEEENPPLPRKEGERWRDVELDLTLAEPLPTSSCSTRKQVNINLSKYPVRLLTHPMVPLKELKKSSRHPIPVKW
jgi:hypothetical protein